MTPTAFARQVEEAWRRRETHWRPVGLGIVDHPDRRHETVAGVLVGSNGVIVLEVEETRAGSTVREYAEIALTPDGARKLAALLTRGADVAEEQMGRLDATLEALAKVEG